MPLLRNITECARGKTLVVFLPGGPGLLPESFNYKSFLKTFSAGLGEVIDFVGVSYEGLADTIRITGNRDMWAKVISDEVDLIAERYQRTFLIGHSFGGMLLASKSFSLTNRTAIFLCTPWSCKWAERTSLKVKGKAMQDAEYYDRALESEPSIENMSKLWRAWCPWYFSPEKQLDGISFINKYLGDPELSRPSFRNKILSSYPGIENFESQVNCKLIFGEDDQITKNDLPTNVSNKIKRISGAGHFPWVDNPTETALTLQKLIGPTNET